MLRKLTESLQPSPGVGDPLRQPAASREAEGFKDTPKGQVKTSHWGVKQEEDDP